MRTRMQPVGNAWQKLPRVVRDLSAELGKPIELVMVGAETELDRQILDVIKDPLTHMVRNSADHGLEPTAERVAAGKPARGTIRLAAYHEGGTVTVEIADDGRGLDLAAIRRKAVERGLASQVEVERMTDAQAAKFIFHAGFSTAAAVTSVSGRGVGMDVVKTNIETIGGVIDIATWPGLGTTFTVKIPLTLAIVAALIVAGWRQPLRAAAGGGAGVGAGRRRRGEPDRAHQRRPGPAPARQPPARHAAPGHPRDGRRGVGRRFRGRRPGRAPALRRTRGRSLPHGGDRREADVGQAPHLSLFAGNTILGDGAVVLIVDPNGIAERVVAAAGRTSRLPWRTRPRRPRTTRQATSSSARARTSGRCRCRW